MNNILAVLDSITSSFGCSTCTGLDVLKVTPTAPAVADELFRSDLIPAEKRDIVATYAEIHGVQPSTDQLLDVEVFLDRFDWLQY